MKTYPLFISITLLILSYSNINNDNSNNIVELCDVCGNLIGTRKNLWDLREYSFDLTIFEERYNTVIFQGGMVGLKYAR